MMNFHEVRDRFLKTFSQAGFRESQPLSLLQPSITTSFLFSVGFVDVMQAIAGNAVELDGAATVQRCFRHFDMDRVGDGHHLSFFEMAGALKCRQCKIADLVFPLIEYLVKDCNLPIERLHTSYFGGGMVGATILPPDHQARDAYRKAGIPEERLWPGDRSSNIWFEGANSGTERSGICGPNSEIFLELSPHSDGESPLNTPSKFIELTNIVTITHRKNIQNDVEKLPMPLVELALGMERIEMVMGGHKDVHETPKLRKIAESVLQFSSFHPERTALNIMVDHLRALVHLMADGARPGPKGRQHVVRRLFRRLLRTSSLLSLDVRAAFPKVALTVIEVDRTINPNLSQEMPGILETFDREADRISKSTADPVI